MQDNCTIIAALQDYYHILQPFCPNLFLGMEEKLVDRLVAAPVKKESKVRDAEQESARAVESDFRKSKKSRIPKSF